MFDPSRVLESAAKANLLVTLIVRYSVSSVHLLLCFGPNQVDPLEEHAMLLEPIQPLLCALQKRCLLMLLL